MTHTKYLVGIILGKNPSVVKSLVSYSLAAESTSLISLNREQGEREEMVGF